MLTMFLLGVFLVKYKVEMLFFLPFLAGSFCYYFHISLKVDSAAQKPEKLYRETNLILYVGILLLIFCLCMFIHIPSLHVLLDENLLKLGG